MTTVQAWCLSLFSHIHCTNVR